MGLFRRDLDCLLKVFCYFKAMFCSASGDAFFILHSVEEGDGIGGVTYCTPNILESVCRGVLVLIWARQAVTVLSTRPSYGDG